MAAAMKSRVSLVTGSVSPVQPSDLTALEWVELIGEATRELTMDCFHGLKGIPGIVKDMPISKPMALRPLMGIDVAHGPDDVYVVCADIVQSDERQDYLLLQRTSSYNPCFFYLKTWWRERGGKMRVWKLELRVCDLASYLESLGSEAWDIGLQILAKLHAGQGDTHGAFSAREKKTYRAERKLRGYLERLGVWPLDY